MIAVAVLAPAGTPASPNLKISIYSCRICDRAIRDEGLSHRYLPFDKYALP
jgi:hypothetical protein